MDMNPVPAQTTGDERLLLLAIALDTRVGLSFEDVVRTGLLGDPDAVKPDTLRHTFLLYRRQLEELGIRVVETGGGEPRYKVDAHLTYADQQDVDLTHGEEMELVALLTFYLGGSSGGSHAPYATEVRKARDKLASVAGLAGGAAGLEAAGPAGTAPTNTDRTSDKVLGELLRAYTDQAAAVFRYTNARGACEQRRVHIYGMFERRGHTYVVGRDASCKVGDGGTWHDAVRVFRDDRIEARSVKVDPRDRYDVPSDFDVNSYMRLPFQYGPEKPFIARFEPLSGHTPREFDALTARGGAWKTDGGGRAVWEVEATDLDALASWAVQALAEGLAARTPQRLVDALAAGLERAEKTHA